MAPKALNILMLGFYPFYPGKVNGGTQAVVHALAPALSEQPDVAHVTVLSFHNGEVPSVTKRHSDTFEVRYVRGQNRLSVLTRSFIEVAKARRVVAELQPDIVHGHGMGWSGDVATQVGPKSVVTIHGLIQREVRMKAKTSLRNRLRVYLVDTMAKQVLKHAKLVISISSYDSKLMHDLVRNKHVTIPNAIGPEFFVDRPPAPVNQRVLFAGVLRPRKNAEGIVNAFALARKRHPNAQLMIIGPSPDPVYAKQIRDQVAALGLNDAVDFVGYVENDRLSQEIHDCRVLALFSHEETLPTIIAQACAMGKPVVASNVGGVSDMLTDGVNGFLIEPGNEQMFADRLCDVLDSPELSARMGAQGREMAHQRFTAPAVARQTVAAYRTIL